MDPITLGAISVGASALGNIFNVGSQRRENRKQRDFTREMYQTQKQDNIDFWRMQNEYNTPAAQMERYMDAGLNPHLAYTQANTAAPISSPQPTQGPNTQAAQVDFDPLSELAKGLNLQMMNEQVLAQKLSNEEKALELEDEKWFRQNYADVIGIDGVISGESLYRRMKRAEVDSSIQTLQNAVLDSKRIQALTGQIIEETKMTKLQQLMQEVENDLASVGVFRGDSVFDRVLMQMTDEDYTRLLGSGSMQSIREATKMILDRIIGRKVYRK